MRDLYSFPHPVGAPGIGTTAVYQILGLVARGHEVTVATTSVHPAAPELPDTIQTMVVGGVRIPHRLLGMDRAMAYHDYRTARLLKRRAGAFDIVHCWPGATLSTARMARGLGIPAVREVPNTHTANAYEVVGRVCDDMGMKLPRGHSHRANPRRLKLEEEEYNAAVGLLTPSDHVAETFLERGYPGDKLLRHSYGFDPKVFTPDPDEETLSPPHAAFLGSVDPRKGLHVALEAWQRSRAFEKARFSIYGKVVQGYERLIEPYLSLPGVNMYDFTADTARAFHFADLLLLPSFEEGSALVTYEAQGCGVVPLVSDAAGAQCTDGVTGFVHHAGDVDQLAHQISRLVEEPKLLRTMRRNVIRGRERLTWSAAAERLEHCSQVARSRPLRLAA